MFPSPCMISFLPQRSYLAHFSVEFGMTQLFYFWFPSHVHIRLICDIRRQIFILPKRISRAEKYPYQQEYKKIFNFCVSLEEEAPYSEWANRKLENRFKLLLDLGHNEKHKINIPFRTKEVMLLFGKSFYSGKEQTKM